MKTPAGDVDSPPGRILQNCEEDTKVVKIEMVEFWGKWLLHVYVLYLSGVRVVEGHTLNKKAHGQVFISRDSTIPSTSVENAMGNALPLDQT